MRLRFTRRAVDQIDAALAYLQQRSPQGADSVRARLMAVLAVLQHQPRIGRQTSRRGVLRIGMPPYPYLIDYHLADTEILVLRFRHAARRPLS